MTEKSGKRNKRAHPPDILLCFFFFISPGKHVRHMVTLHTEALQALEAMWTTWHHAVNPESSTEAASIQRV